MSSRVMRAAARHRPREPVAVREPGAAGVGVVGDLLSGIDRADRVVGVVGDVEWLAGELNDSSMIRCGRVLMLSWVVAKRSGST
jgi:hypothetical protein